MRIALSLFAVLVLAIGAAAIFFRLVPMPPETWHVEPSEVTPPDSPNYVLLVGEDAPRFDTTPDRTALHLDAIATARRYDLIAGDLGEGHMTYVARTRLMGFPDAISVRLRPDGDGTRVEVFSRSRFGYSDMGKNAARLDSWLEAARAL